MQTAAAATLKDQHLLSEQQRRQFADDGFIVLRQAFTKAQIAALRAVGEADPVVSAARKTSAKQIKLWDECTDDIYSAFALQQKIVGPVAQVLGGPIEHYHHKLIVKEKAPASLTTGTWEWHQDYGYWYNGYLRPDLASCFIAVDKATQKNGALTVLKGSHRVGRIDHVEVRGQPGGEPDRVERLTEEFEVVVAEMEPGDILIFHCNTFHHSNPNFTDDPRWALVTCYSAVNNPLSNGEGGERTPLVPMAAEELLDVGRRNLARLQSRGFARSSAGANL